MRIAILFLLTLLVSLSYATNYYLVLTKGTVPKPNTNYKFKFTFTDGTTPGDVESVQAHSSCSGTTDNICFNSDATYFTYTTFARSSAPTDLSAVKYSTDGGDSYIDCTSYTSSSITDGAAKEITCISGLKITIYYSTTTSPTITACTPGTSLVYAVTATTGTAPAATTAYSAKIVFKVGGADAAKTTASATSNSEKAITYLKTAVLDGRPTTIASAAFVDGSNTETDLSTVPTLSFNEDLEATGTSPTSLHFTVTAACPSSSGSALQVGLTTLILLVAVLVSLF